MMTAARVGGRRARRQTEERDKQIDSKEDTHPICCPFPLIPSYRSCVVEIHHLGPTEDGVMSAAEDTGNFLSKH